MLKLAKYVLQKRKKKLAKILYKRILITDRKMWYEVINSKWTFNTLQLTIYTQRHSELNDILNVNL